MNRSVVCSFILAAIVFAKVGTAVAQGEVAEAQLVYAYEVFLSHDPVGPDSADIWLKLGNLHLRHARYAEARNAYRHVADLGSERGRMQLAMAGRLGVGLSYSGEQRYRFAFRELTAALDQAAGEAIVGNILAIYRELASIALRIEDFEAVLTYGPAARDAYQHLGQFEDEALMWLLAGIAHAEQGSAGEAERAFIRSRRLFELDGAEDGARRVQRVLRIARGYGIDMGGF